MPNKLRAAFVGALLCGGIAGVTAAYIRQSSHVLGEIPIVRSGANDFELTGIQGEYLDGPPLGLVGQQDLVIRDSRLSQIMEICADRLLGSVQWSNGQIMPRSNS